MEESISSSRTSTALCGNIDGYYGYGITTAAASEDSGWTAYFDDFLKASPSREETSPAPAREELHHGVRATASTLSSSANNNKLVKVKGAGQEKKKKKKTAHHLELEDPLQDTASSLQMQLNCTFRMSGALLAAVSKLGQQCSSNGVQQETSMGLGWARCSKQQGAMAATTNECCMYRLILNYWSSVFVDQLASSQQHLL